MLTLLLGLAILDLLLPALSWRLHVWSKRRDGITGIERTRGWEWLRVVRGCLMLLLAGVVLFWSVSRGGDALPEKESKFEMPAGFDPSQLPAGLQDGVSSEELEDLKESLEGARSVGR